MSNRPGFNLLLLGAYGSEELVCASDQLARRLGVLHYERYKENDDDFAEYATFIKSVSAAMPYRFEINLEKCVEYLFDGTFGLPAASVDVLRSAAAAIFEKEKDPRWSDTYLKQSMPSRKAQRVMARATVLGEDRVQPYLQMEGTVEYATEADIRYELKQENEERNRLNRRS